MLLNIHNILCNNNNYCSYNTDAKLELQRIKSQTRNKLVANLNFIPWLGCCKFVCLSLGVNVNRITDFENKVWDKLFTEVGF